MINQELKYILMKYAFKRNRPISHPIIGKNDISTLKKLGLNKELVICPPDKGKGVVIMNREDYCRKMMNILGDVSKFRPSDIDPFKLSIKLEDKLNRYLLKLNNSNIITDDLYNVLRASGTSLGVLYGSPKVHKTDCPLRPILAAYNTHNYKLAKYLSNLLIPYTSSEHTLTNSLQFVNQILPHNGSHIMASFDVESLYTNVPLREAIEITANTVYDNPLHTFPFSKDIFIKLLELATLDSFFVFDHGVYQQIDGVAMGSPLAPALANIFLIYLEKKLFSSDNNTNAHWPTFYKRYVDDTFATFRQREDIEIFLTSINSLHEQIKFTVEIESDSALPFLDVRITRSNNTFSSGVYRKGSFTGLGTNFLSCCPRIFKINACKTLIFRAYHLSSSLMTFHREMEFLESFFKSNSVPMQIFHRCTRNFLDKIYRPSQPITTVSKELRYFSLPYIGKLTSKLNRELVALLSSAFPTIEFRLVYSNPYCIGTLLPYKDKFCSAMRSSVVYHYKCPRCNLGTYIGSTSRLLRVRMSEHFGISHRTSEPLTQKENSPIARHAERCHVYFNLRDVTIIETASDEKSLRIAESILIRKNNPSLNRDVAAYPLLLK